VGGHTPFETASPGRGFFLRRGAKLAKIERRVTLPHEWWARELAGTMLAKGARDHGTDEALFG